MFISVLKTAFVMSIAGLLLGRSVAAQDTTLFCGELSEADCEIIAASQEAMSALESAAVKFDLDMTFSGIPDTPSSATISLSGDGRYAITDAEALQNYAAVMTDDMAAAMEDLVRAFSLEGSMIIQLPAEILGDSSPNRGALSLRLVDGFLYVNFDKMMELMGSSNASGWLGFDLAGFYSRMFDQVNIDPIVPSQSTVADVMGDLVTIERVEDVEIDGQTFAAFHYDVDYSSFLSNEIFRSLMRSQIENMNMPMQMDTDALLDLYAEAFASLNLEYTQLIALDDYYIHRLSFQMNWDLDMDSFGELLGGMTESVPDITINISANVDLSHFNEAAPIEAPENATIFPLDSLLPAMPQAFEIEAAA